MEQNHRLVTTTKFYSTLHDNIKDKRYFVTHLDTNKEGIYNLFEIVLR